jgi:large subunit ribosomal protein L19
MNIMDSIRQQQLRKDVPDFHVGDTVRVAVRVREGDKTRTQLFEGVVIDRRGGQIEESFTVRKISAGIAVERVFPLHSPNVVSIEVSRRGRVRRARLNYLRGRSGKGARIQQQEGAEAVAREPGTDAIATGSGTDAAPPEPAAEDGKA